VDYSFKNVSVLPAPIVGCQDEEMDYWVVKFVIVHDKKYSDPLYYYFKTQEDAADFSAWLSGATLIEGQFIENYRKEQYHGQSPTRIKLPKNLSEQRKVGRDRIGKRKNIQKV